MIVIAWVSPEPCRCCGRSDGYVGWEIVYAPILGTWMYRKQLVLREFRVATIGM